MSGQRPDLERVESADGASDNWTFLGRVLPHGVERIDFHHAAEHLEDAFDAADGPMTPGRRRSSRRTVIGCATRPGEPQRSSAHCDIYARPVPDVNASRKCSATSATIATAWAMPRRRTRGDPSAPQWSRRHARLWSRNGSSVRACDGVSGAGRPFRRCARYCKAIASSQGGRCCRRRIALKCPFPIMSCPCADQSSAKQ